MVLHIFWNIEKYLQILKFAYITYILIFHEFSFLFLEEKSNLDNIFTIKFPCINKFFLSSDEHDTKMLDIETVLTWIYFLRI